MRPLAESHAPEVVFSKFPEDLPDYSIAPICDIDHNSQLSSASFTVYSSSFSTYPDTCTHPNADSHSFRITDDMAVISLCDGCGLSENSKNASMAAIEGFFLFLDSQLQAKKLPETTREIAYTLWNGIHAAHMHIFWKAYIQNKKSMKDYLRYLKSQILLKERKVCILKQELKQNKSLPFSPLTRLIKRSEINIEEELTFHERRMLSLKEENELIKQANKNNYYAQIKLLENEWSSKWFQKEVGASTLLTAALCRMQGKKDLYYLLCGNVGDCQAFLLRNNSIEWLTQSMRPAPNNFTDPGGRIGKCNIKPFSPDFRNLLFSFVQCKKGDKIFFISDGVWDNLDPMHLGFHPNGSFQHTKLKELFIKATQCSQAVLQELQKKLTARETKWSLCSLDTVKLLKKNFSTSLMEHLIHNTNPQESLHRLAQYCSDITSLHRDTSYSPSIGKPDHTTIIVLHIT